MKRWFGTCGGLRCEQAAEQTRPTSPVPPPSRETRRGGARPPCGGQMPLDLTAPRHSGLHAPACEPERMRRLVPIVLAAALLAGCNDEPESAAPPRAETERALTGSPAPLAALHR